MVIKIGIGLALMICALWANQTTHSVVTGYMLAKPMFDQNLIMLVEWTISSWMAVDWMVSQIDHKLKR